MNKLEEVNAELLERLNKELIELHIKRSTLLKEIEKVMLSFCKKQYEGKIIAKGKEEFKIRKIKSVRGSNYGGEWIVVATGDELETQYFFDDIPIKIGNSYTTTGIQREFRVLGNGKLSDNYTICENTENFKKEYSHWLSNIEKFKDANGEYIRSKRTRVCFFENNKFRKGLVLDFDTKQNKFEIQDISNDIDINNRKIIYLEGNQFIKI